ncbi:hypothetical protein [Micromonospora sp. NPDC005652]|uniref:hypothetical protein n=1 Tax=Micromonospora sp. NPDC005652 TaxID=3157046 RepID=UPI003411EF73
MTEAFDFQRELAEHIAELAAQAAVTHTPGVTWHDGALDRLEALVASILCDLQGDGGVSRQYRLTSKETPAVDLLEDGLRVRWLRRTSEGLGRDFLSWLHFELGRASAARSLSEAVGRLTEGVAAAIERDYHLTPALYDDNGMYEESGPDIAPGLTEAVRTAWSAR